MLTASLWDSLVVLECDMHDPDISSLTFLLCIISAAILLLLDAVLML